MVETVSRVGRQNGPSFGWRMTVDHGPTRVVALSDGRIAGDFPELGAVSALIVGGDQPIASLSAIDARALVVSAQVIAGGALRAEVAKTVPGRIWTVRVFPGDAMRLDFVAHGLKLPANALAVDGTPTADLPAPR
jgi:hypothetical protein